jgi:hypothetical protein
VCHSRGGYYSRAVTIIGAVIIQGNTVLSRPIPIIKNLF